MWQNKSKLHAFIFRDKESLHFKTLMSERLSWERQVL